TWGASKGPPNPQNVRSAPAEAVALLCLPKSPTPGKDCRSQESFFLSCQRPGAGRYSHTDDSRPCPHAASPCSSSVTMTHTWGDAPGCCRSDSAIASSLTVAQQSV